YCILHWCWFLDRPRIEPTVDVGAGVRLPTYASGPSSHGWWAMVITLIVAGMVGTLLGFSYVFLWSRQPESWTPPPDLPLLFPVIGAYAAAAALAWGSCRTLRLDRRRTPALATLMMLTAVALVGTGWGLDLNHWLATGLRPEVNAQGATVYGLLGWQGFFVAVSGLMAFYALLRWLAGHVEAARPSTFDLIGLFVGFTAAQGFGAVLLTRLFPGAWM